VGSDGRTGDAGGRRQVAAASRDLSTVRRPQPAPPRSDVRGQGRLRSADPARLCTYGIACKAVVDHALGGDTTGIAACSARFAGTVHPGETLEGVAAWRHDDGLAVQATVKERGVVALANGLVTLVDPLSVTPGEPR
jgi:hypothetical protein